MPSGNLGTEEEEEEVRSLGKPAAAKQQPAVVSDNLSEEDGRKEGGSMKGSVVMSDVCWHLAVVPLNAATR